MIKYSIVPIILIIYFLYEYNDDKSKQTIEKDLLMIAEHSSVVKDDISPANTTIDETVVQNEMKIDNDEEIIPGEDLTLESIENADVSNEEKQNMLDDLAYFESVATNIEESLSEDEIREVFSHDLEKEMNLN